MTTEVRPLPLKEQFLNLDSPQAVADLLHIKYKTLNYLLYGLSPSEKYKVVEIAKKTGGKRRLLIPIPLLKHVQSRLYQILRTVYEPRATTHGFVPGRSMLTNAESHIGRRKKTFVYNVDIENFFPSIKIWRVRGMFMAKPYNLPQSVATVIAQLCCVNDQLPQGSPTSPIIANMICGKLDAQLRKLANDHNCVYTRYADDLTFSTSLRSFPAQLADSIAEPTGKKIVFGNDLLNIMKANDFSLNAAKIRLQTADRRQEVTGITVNKIANVPRKHINQVRAMLHAWKKYGYNKAQEEHFAKWKRTNRPIPRKSSFYKIVRGKIEYIRMVRGHQNRTYRRLWNSFAELPENSKLEKLPMGDQIFISYSHKDAKWLKELKKHLKVLEQKDLLRTWDDSKIKPGSKWHEEIKKVLGSAKAAVLLISPNFFDSEFIVNEELQPLLRSAEKEGLKILWIPISSSMYKATDIKDYQALHNPAEPLDTLTKAKLNSALVQICEKIREA